MIWLTDKIIFDGNVTPTKDGYLKAFVRAGRTGIQRYKGYELDKPHLTDVAVYRPPEEVFRRDAMQSAAHKPVTLLHPERPVNSGSWKDHAIGFMGDEIVRDGDHVRVPMMMCDQAAIDSYRQHGIRELSLGYSCDMDWTPGETPSGEHYDAKQTNIRVNHLAVVPVARGGSTLRIGDAGTKQCPTCHADIPAEAERCPKCNHDVSMVDDDWTKMSYDEAPFYDREFSIEERKKLAKSGAAMAHGGYPIKNTGDLKNAIRAIGRAKNPAATKAHIIKRAKALGATNELPDDWTSSTKDAATGHKEINMAKFMVDGVPVELEDRDIAVIKQALAKRDAAASAANEELEEEKKLRQQADDAKNGMKKECDAKDGQIAVLTKQLADAKISPQVLDQMVKDRMTVIGKARSVVGDSYVVDGKSLEDIRRATVAANLGDEMVKTMNDAQIEGAFLACTKDAGSPVNMLARSISDSQQSGYAPGFAMHQPGQRQLYDAGVPREGAALREKAFQDSQKALTEAWKTPAPAIPRQ